MIFIENKELQHQIQSATKFAGIQAEKISELEKLICQMAESSRYLKEAVVSEKDDIERYRKNRDDTWNSLCDLLDQ